MRAIAPSPLLTRLRTHRERRASHRAPDFAVPV